MPRPILRPPANCSSPGLGENKTVAFGNPKEGFSQPLAHLTPPPIHSWEPGHVFLEKPRSIFQDSQPISGLFLPKIQSAGALPKPQKTPKHTVPYPASCLEETHPCSPPTRFSFVSQRGGQGIRGRSCLPKTYNITFPVGLLGAQARRSIWI